MKTRNPIRQLADKTRNYNAKLKIVALIAVGVVLVGIIAFFRFGSSGSAILWNMSEGGKWLLPLVGISALLDSINPCAFSILLVTIAFLFSVGNLRSRILQVGGFYIFGIFTAYFLIGLGLLQALHLFDTPHFMGKLGAFLLILLGIISIINEFVPSFPIKLRIPHAAHRAMAVYMEKATLPAAFVLGGLVGLCEFPCTGGPYLMVVGFLHDSATYITGVMYLFFYNIIFVAPLVLILLIAGNKFLVEKAEEWQKKERLLMRLGGGIAMIILGIVIFIL